MKTTLIAGFIVAALTTTSLALPGQARAATITEAMAKAIATHPEVIAAEREQAAIGYRVDAARSGYLPTVDLAVGTGYEWSKNTSTRFRAARTPGSGKQGSRDMWRNEARLTAVQMLYDGFQTRSRVAQEKNRFAAAGYHAMDVRNQLALRAAEAYLAVLNAREQLALAQANLEAHQDYLKKIDARVSGGRSSQADVQQVQGRLALAQANVDAVTGDLRAAEAAYLEAVGEMPANVVKTETPFGTIPADTRAAIDRAMGNSPVVAAALANIKAANAQAAEAKSLFCPKITLEGGISRNWNLDGVDGPNHDATAMLMLRQNLYHGGLHVAQRNERLELVKQAQAELEQQRRLVELSVVEAMARLDAARARLTPLAQHVESALSTRDAYVAQFDLGQRSLLDLLDSEVELTNAKAALIDAKYETDASAYAAMAHMGDLAPATAATIDVASR